MPDDINDPSLWYTNGGAPADPTELDLNTLINNANASGAGTIDTSGTDTANTGSDANLYKNPVIGGVNGATNLPSDYVPTDGNSSSVLGALSAWAKANPDLAKALGYTALSGISNAQNQQYQKDLLAQKNQYSIDAANAAKAREDQLWQRRNDSITGTNVANLGIIGRGMIDPTVYAKK